MSTSYPKYLRVALVTLAFLFFASTTSQASFMWQDMEITPRVSTQESYDDNVTTSKENPLTDVINRTAIGLDIKQEGKTHTLTMDANVAHQFFLQNTSFNNTSEDLTASLTKELSKYDQLTISNSLSNAEDANSFQDAFGRTSGRYFTLRNNLNAAVRHDLNQQLTANFRYSNDYTKYSRKDLSDSTMNSAGTGLDYALDSATITSLNYDYSQRKFDPGTDATSHELTLNLRRFLSAQVYFDLQPGVDFFDSYNGQNYTKPLFCAALTNELDENTQTGISFEKQYTMTSSTQDLFDTWRVSVNLVKQLTSRIQGLVNAFYGKGEYLTTSIRERLTGANVGCRYELNKDTSLGLSYSFTQDISTVETSSYTRNVLSLVLNIKF